MTEELLTDPPVRLVMLGRQGSGKGEQCNRLATTFDLDHISTGELLRAEVRHGTPLGREVGCLLERGELVPDDIVADLVAARFAVASEHRRGAVLDGYPRTIEQCERLADVLGDRRVDLAIHLDVPREIAVRRIQSRTVCRSCHRVGHVGPTARCAHCGGMTEHRADDWPAAIGRRMSEYARDIGSVLDWFSEHAALAVIDGCAEPSVVAARVADAVRHDVRPWSRGPRAPAMHVTKETEMQAAVGDRIVIHGHHLGEPDRDCEVLDVPDPTGGPPYRVRWGDTGHEGLFFPGSDATVQHFTHVPRPA